MVAAKDAEIYRRDAKSKGNLLTPAERERILKVWDSLPLRQPGKPTLIYKTALPAKPSL
jgi:hypothetical protein